MRTTLALSTCFLLALSAGSGAQAQNFEWAGQLGGSPGYDHAYDVVVDDNGNVYTVGRFEGTGDFDPGPGVFNLTTGGGRAAFISKLDSGGNFIWAGKLGGAPFVATEANGVALGPDGDIHSVGFFSGTGDFDPGPGTYDLTGVGDDAFISKLDRNGGFIWARRLGGDLEDIGSDVAVDHSGNVYTVGYFNSIADFDPGPGAYQLISAGSRDGFVSKLDSAGNFVWARQLGGASLDDAKDVVVDNSGNVYTMGYFQGTADFDPGPGVYNLTSAGLDDVFISKLDSAGNFVWARGLGGASSERGQWHGDVAVDPSGNVYVVGSFRGTVDFDPGAGVFNLTALGLWDAFVLKLDSNGNFVWARQLAGGNQEFANAVALDATRNVYTIGSFDGTADFDPGPGTFNLSPGSGGYRDVFIVQLDNTGAFLWARRLSGTSSEFGVGVALDGSGNVHAVGHFYSTVDFDPGPGTFNLTSFSNRNVFVCKLRACGNFDDQTAYGQLLFPPRCTRGAATLPQDMYDSSTIGIHETAGDTFYLSSKGSSFAPLIVDDAVDIGGSDCGLGPYGYQPGVPPYILNVAIEDSLVPVPAHDVTGLIPVGTSTVAFELLDTDRVVYGNTAVHLVRDCGIWIDEHSTGETRLNWVSHAVEVDLLQSDLDVVSGMLSDLRLDQNFSHACNLGTFVDTTQGVDTRGDPAAGDGYYYLVNGTCAQPIGYGNSSAGPRTGLPPGPSCP